MGLGVPEIQMPCTYDSLSLYSARPHQAVEDSFGIGLALGRTFPIL